MNKDETIEVTEGPHTGHRATIAGMLKTGSSTYPVAKIHCSCGDVIQVPDDGEIDLATAMAKTSYR